ncbi:MAG TPA: immunoglobulin domain-containing protein [Candidatus Aquilonibacter sp.]|nr:immunoglobulin domain-containing protein [Candidatus Aquilonibacter sp.]
MNKQIPNKNNKILKLTALAAATGVALLAGINIYSQNLAPAAASPAAPPASVVTVAIQPEFPLITSQPEDQMVPFGSNATFTVTAVNADGYQWLRNGNNLDSQTNSSLTITNCGLSDVGYYSCYVFEDTEGVPTRAASLMVYSNSIDPQTGVDPIVVFGLPLFSSGSQSSCPGKYTGYIAYTKSATNGWGWAPDTSNGNTIFTATDTNSANTKIEFCGEYGDNGCNQTTVTVPYPAMSPVYRFCIYFTNNVPTNAYPITLDGFLP